jgi:threonine/homoserine/homoserine lactone efflux protein
MGELVMFPTEVRAAYLLAALIVVIAPGRDNILAISRGMGQGRSAAAMSSLGAGLGIMVHTIAATLGVAVVLQTSPVAFWVVEVVGAAYLVWLGWRALRSRSLIALSPSIASPCRAFSRPGSCPTS